jgi:nicotinamide-nucleotide amidase
MAIRSVRSMASEVLRRARARGVTIATAESCTGGMVAAALTAIPGSSDVVDRGFVTYSNAAKTAMLGVPEAMIARHGAVSAEVAGAMALGALKASGATLTVSITGIAGPGGGSEAKPVGRVHFAAAAADGRVQRLERQFGAIGRARVRDRAMREALDLLLAMLDSGPVQSA